MLCCGPAPLEGASEMEVEMPALRSTAWSTAPDRVDCPECFTSARLVIRDTETANRIETGSPARNDTLAELGVPLMDVLEAKAVEAEHTIFFQFDGDRESVFSSRDDGAHRDDSTKPERRL